MSHCGFDASPGDRRQLCGKKECERQAGWSGPPHVSERSAWRWAPSALPGGARGRVRSCLYALGCAAALASSLPAAKTAVSPKATETVAAATAQAAAGTNAAPRFDIQAYVIKRDPLVFTNAPALTLSAYTGANIGLDRIAQAAKELLFEYQKQGYTRANISIAQELI